MRQASTDLSSPRSAFRFALIKINANRQIARFESVWAISACSSVICFGPYPDREEDMSAVSPGGRGSEHSGCPKNADSVEKVFSGGPHRTMSPNEQELIWP
jgi:hypothetical protein